MAGAAGQDHVAPDDDDMPPHTRKRSRVPARIENDNESVVTAQSNSSRESLPYINPLFTDFDKLAASFMQSAHRILTLPNLLDDFTTPDRIDTFFRLFGILSLAAIEVFPRVELDIARKNILCQTTSRLARQFSHPFKKDAATSTEPIPDTPKPTYASVAAQVDAPTPSSPAQPQGPSPSRSPSHTHVTTTGSGPPGHSPKTSIPKPRKSARFTGTSHKSPSPDLPKSKSGQQVRLVACIANHPNASTSDNPRFKTFPTDCFADLSKTLKSSAPGCVPLGFHLNRKGNILITFTPTTPRSLLMSNLWIIRGAFELSHNVPILLDTTWSTIHLANVPTRSNESAPVFDQAEIAATLQNNPALATLPITLQPRWLRHPSKISGPRSSVVFSFEDPDGAIARQLLKTPTFMFGQPVTVKPWINKPASTARPPPSVPISVFPVSAVTNECSSMDLN